MIVRELSSDEIDNFYIDAHGFIPPVPIEAVGGIDGDIKFIFGVHPFETQKTKGKPAYVAFSESLIDFSEHKRDIVKASKKFIAIMKRNNKPVVAVLEGEASFLMHLGFKQFKGRIYKWLG